MQRNRGQCRVSEDDYSMRMIASWKTSRDLVHSSATFFIFSATLPHQEHSFVKQYVSSKFYKIACIWCSLCIAWQKKATLGDQMFLSNRIFACWCVMASNYQVLVRGLLSQLKTRVAPWWLLIQNTEYSHNLQ